MRKTHYMLALLIALLTLMLPAVASARDRDHDGLPDRWEKRHKLSLERDSAHSDRDRDKVDNANEYRQGTNPRKRDTNNNGKNDGLEDRDRDRMSNRMEDATGNDPRNPDTDGDGVRDGRERAGVVRSFEDGLLTIALPNGSSLSAYVTEETDFKCKSESLTERAHRKSRGKAHKATGDGEYDGEYEGEGEGEDPDELGDDELELDEDFPEDKHEGDDDHGKKHCSADDVKPGMGVHKAKLTLTADGLEFKRVTLLLDR
jgi:hypothetical protein